MHLEKVISDEMMIFARNSPNWKLALEMGAVAPKLTPLADS